MYLAFDFKHTLNLLSATWHYENAMKKYLLLLITFLLITNLDAQHSIARQWNEMVLEAIRADFARPTVHARNLFHTSAAMYDAWAIYEDDVDTYFLGKTVHGYNTPIIEIPKPADKRAAQEEAISYAVYRILKHRFQSSPRVVILFDELDDFMDELGYDKDNTNRDFTCSPAGMGNYIAEHIIAYGLTDGSNEENEYGNLYYEPVNPSLVIRNSGNPNFTDLNRWQPLEFDVFIDQSGTVSSPVPNFLSPEWGNVNAFSLNENDATIYQRDGFDYKVYHDPGNPPYLDTTQVGGLSEEYKWGHSLVSVWSSHLDPADGVLWDISPASIGNIQTYPTDIPSLRNFYNLEDGGDISPGHSMNPKTGQPYAPQIVPRADYARILAEFWADGPDSETPPGHWFTILNYVNDHPSLVKKYRGQGEIVNDLEWDVKAYFILGGTMHDVAITAWGIKGWYDYIRPVSAIRGMAELGQSSDVNLPNYHAGGIHLIPDYVELIQAGDALAGDNGQYINDIKLKAWKGPNFILDPRNDVAGVDWIRAADWYPYQRPSFVTPPFAGYVSGHSTYSRAAAEVLTMLTGDEFFPGGLGEFFAPRNMFLVFEDGPTIDITLQWATYRDASDQCSLSRIWGGIHPPVDDIPGRLIGETIGIEAFNYAEQYFTKVETPNVVNELVVYPNPSSCVVNIDYEYDGEILVQIYQIDGKFVTEKVAVFNNNRAFVDLCEAANGTYILKGFDENGDVLFTEKIVLF